MTPTQKLRIVTKALEFYADPMTYTAVMFLADPPCGDFIRDISELDGEPEVLDAEPIDTPRGKRIWAT